MTRKINWSWTVFGILAVVWVASCKKDKEEEDEPVSLASYDIHMAAVEMKDGVAVPYYIKNGVLEALPHEGDAGAAVYGIFVAAGDVYMTGHYKEDLGASTPSVRPVWWKNGVMQKLETAPNIPYADTRAIYVSGGDVYVAGQANVPGQRTTPTVWKNGVAHPVTDGENYGGLEDIFVVGEDVYVVGYETHDKVNVAKYWKNGEEVVLTDGRFQSYAISIYVDGTDIYVTGYAYEDDGCNIKLWKNGEATNLTSGSLVAQGRKVWVEDGSVYVGGYEQVGSKYEPFAWKDGERIKLDFFDEESSLAYDATVVNGNFFVLGTQRTGGARQLTVWLNGDPKTVTSNSQGLSAHSFFVLPKN